MRDGAGRPPSLCETRRALVTCASVALILALAWARTPRNTRRARDARRIRTRFGTPSWRDLVLVHGRSRLLGRLRRQYPDQNWTLERDATGVRHPTLTPTFLTAQLAAVPAELAALAEAREGVAGWVPRRRVPATALAEGYEEFRRGLCRRLAA
jgi:hypothetical protein